jgi:hypothetical protein
MQVPAEATLIGASIVVIRELPGTARNASAVGAG